MRFIKKISSRLLFIVFVTIKTYSIHAQQITRIEYFLNEDPGFGLATPVPITPGAKLVQIDFDAAIQNLPVGINTIGIRSFDNNSWSLTRLVSFLKNKLPSGNINFLEYFIDADPGFGNGTSVNITPAADVADISFNVNIENLQDGDHVFFIRSRSSDGRWSITSVVPFNNDPLPVSFLNFSALLYNKTVQLEWATATETNNSHFVIERAAGNSGRFDSIGKTTGAGNSILVKQYKFLDNNVQGKNFYKYRIRQVDFDGRFSYSAIKIITLSATNMPIQIAPTVTRNTLWVNHAKRGTLLGVYDASGKQVQQTILQGDRDQIHLTGLKKGIYILVVHQEGRVLHHQKVLIE